jgi:hypothetical protein
MKISEITATDVATYLRLESEQCDATVLAAIMAAAEKFIADYTGIPATSQDLAADTLDNHEDFYPVYMILCQDMHDNRSLYVEKSNINRVFETILGAHCVNLL